MAIGIKTLRSDGSAEVVARFKHPEALEQAEAIALSIIKRGFQVEVDKDLPWPIQQEENIWGVK